MALSDMDIVNIWPVSMTLMFFFLLSLVAAGVTAGSGGLGLVSLVICGMSGSLLLFLAAPVFLVSQRLRSRRREEDEEGVNEEINSGEVPPSVRS